MKGEKKREGVLARLFGFAVLACLVFLLLCSSLAFVSALATSKEVAYITTQKTIKPEIKSALNELGLNVTLVKDSTLTSSTNLSKYRMLFIDDVILSKAKNLPIYNYPSIIMNKYYGPEWGLTDRDGISQLASTSPLQVLLVDDGRVDVYTQAKEYQTSLSIPYYYLEDLNKNTKDKIVMESVARAFTPSFDGEIIEFGDAVGAIQKGTILENGRKSGGKICFYGIAKTQYWTSDARELFLKCANSVLIECKNNSECNDNRIDTYDKCENPGTVNSYCNNTPIKCFDKSDCGRDGFAGNKFCTGNNITRNYISFTCNNPGTDKSFCSNLTSLTVNQTCEFGCLNAMCTIGVHDVSLIDVSSAAGKIEFKNSSGGDMDGDLICNDSYRVYIKAENKGNFFENITYNGIIDGLFFSHEQTNNLDPGETTGSKYKTVKFNLGEGFYNITVQALINNDSNPSDNLVSKQIFISCPPINCSSNLECADGNLSTEDICQNPGTIISYCSHNPIACFADNDCGANSFIGNLFCTGNNVTQSINRFTCNNPGTSMSYCSNSTSLFVNKTCTDYCSNGICKDFKCHNDNECDDEDILTLDRCLNPSTLQSRCIHESINCFSNEDCGNTGYLGNEYCSSNKIFKNYQNATCNNPGTHESYCSLLVTQRLVDNCQFACFGSTCIVCDSDSDCNDNNSSTQDKCINPGTLQSYCNNIPIIENINCYSDSECGVQKSSLSCNGNNLVNTTILPACNDAGTAQSFCSNISSSSSISCEYGCNSTSLSCNNQPTPQIRCYNKLDCGADGFIGNNFCIEDNVTRNYISFTCNNPGTSMSFCSNSTSIFINKTCHDYCLNGECADFVCEKDSDCNDDNSSTIDRCHFPGTISSYCTNDPIIPPIVCYSDSECGTQKSSLSCNGNNLINTTITPICHNPGMQLSYCSNASSSSSISCEYGCNSTSLSCNNQPTPSIKCHSKADCGTDTFIRNLFCTGKDLTQNYLAFTCHYAGTSMSFCSNSTSLFVNKTCADYCLNGECADFVCEKDEDCNDNNSSTQDKCINPGTIDSFCSHENQCSYDSNWKNFNTNRGACIQNNGDCHDTACSIQGGYCGCSASGFGLDWIQLYRSGSCINENGYRFLCSDTSCNMVRGTGMGKTLDIPSTGNYYVSVNAGWDNDSEAENLYVGVNSWGNDSNRRAVHDFDNKTKCVFKNTFSINSDHAKVWVETSSNSGSVHVNNFRVSSCIPSDINVYCDDGGHIL